MSLSLLFLCGHTIQVYSGVVYCYYVVNELFYCDVMHMYIMKINWVISFGFTGFWVFEECQ